MVDERIQSLIHAELDGETLDGAQRAELERALAASAEARKLRDDLQAIDAALSRMPEAPVPADLHRSVIQALDKVAPAKAKVIGLDAFRGRRREVTRIGFALAAGVALGAIGLQLVQPAAPVVEPGDLAGAMVRRAQEEVEAGTLRVDTPEVKGTATLFEADGALVLQFDLESGAPVSVNAAYAPAGLRLLGFAQGAVKTPDIRSTQGAVGYTSQGDQRFVVYLARTTPKGGDIRLTFKSGDQTVHEAALAVPGAQGGGR